MAGDECRSLPPALLLGTCGPSGQETAVHGCEFGQVREWTHDASLEWHVLQYRSIRVQHWMRDLNQFYKQTPRCGSWISRRGLPVDRLQQRGHGVLVYLRKGKRPGDFTLVALNFTPVRATTTDRSAPRALARAPQQ